MALVSGKRNNIYLFVILVLAEVLLTIFSDIAADSVKSTLVLCATSIIPSLFPFMVLSSLIISTFSRVTSGIKSGILVIIPFVLGALCGFPVGASSVALLYKNGVFPRRRAEYLCALCNNTGPAFIVGVVGETFWGSFESGVIFYVCQLLSAIAVFLVWYVIFGRCILRNDDLMKVDKNETEKSNSANVDYGFSGAFCGAVTSSAMSMINVCGYIIFFKTICDIIRYLLFPKEYFGIIYSLSTSIFEFTSGAAASAEMGGIFGFALCGFAIVFSGLSVMAQSAGFLCAAGLSPIPMIRMKLMMGMVSAALCGISYRIFNPVQAVFLDKTIRYPHDFLKILAIFLVVLFAVLKVFEFVKKLITKSAL